MFDTLRPVAPPLTLRAAGDSAMATVPGFARRGSPCRPPWCRLRSGGGDAQGQADTATSAAQGTLSSVSAGRVALQRFRAFGSPHGPPRCGRMSP
jgi:hypothetical protein